MGSHRPREFEIPEREFSWKDLQKMGVKERRKYDLPVKPDRFLEKKNAKLDVIWEEFIAPVPWLVQADTPKSILFCHQWKQFTEEPESSHNKSRRLVTSLRNLMSDLGLDPLARVRMHRANLPVADVSKYIRLPGHGAKVNGKKRDKARREATQAETAAGGFDHYAS